MQPEVQPKKPFLHKFSSGSPLKMLLAVLVVALVAGVGTGYILASPSGAKNSPISLNKQPEHAGGDNKTFRDPAEGKITPIPEDKRTGDNAGTHLLIRDGATPVTLTSSVVDLSKYENKEVKIMGETQNVPGIEWFMDVGIVEEK